MDNQNEYEVRCKAIQLYKDGFGFNKILQLVQKGKGWLSKLFFSLCFFRFFRFFADDLDAGGFVMRVKVIGKRD